jgi:hypothetical protein
LDLIGGRYRFFREAKTVMGLAQEAKRPPRCVVYTCWFGFSEHFNDFVYDRADNIDFICLTDDRELKSAFWSARYVDFGMLDPARAAKKIKALPHQFLPEYDWSLYIDNTVRLKTSPQRIFDEFLADAPSPLVCFRHSHRKCVYDEAEVVIKAGYDDPSRVRAQMRFYRHLGYPAKAGLATTSFLLRRHCDPVLRPVMKQWHEQVLCHSKRDQLSLNPVMWFEKFEPAYLPFRFADFELFDWPVIRGGIRIPRDFDNARYLKSNKDVMINPRRHYLYHGAAEGRRYKGAPETFANVWRRLIGAWHRLKW